jgi:hypothetical protein
VTNDAWVIVIVGGGIVLGWLISLVLSVFRR